MRQLSEREAKLVAIGILVAVIAITWVGIISPIMDGFLERSEERTALLDTYARNQRVLAGIPVWRVQADAQKETEAKFAILAPS
ncbi:MAG TPA: hypothetical protein VIJ62_02500 [Rhizomicrobium sp.]